ncbi:MAG TPA: PDZ domain-containing protein [bacterium]|nr:PDZ domain-containing protein [bacterium]HPR86916.1 PDZ domain-containing protein [bacterium]
MKMGFARTGIVLFILAFLSTALLGAQEAESRAVHKGGAWLGLYLGDTENDNNWEDTEGAVVREVVKDGPADQAGVKEGDVIIKLQDRTVRDADDITRDIRKMSPGDEATLLVLRDGKKITLKAKLQERHKPIGIKTPQPERRLERTREVQPFGNFFMRANRRMGVQLQELDADLAEYFKVKEGEGVLVTSVAEESAAAAAGLKAGDVLMTVDDQPVHRISEVTSAVQENESDTLKVSYMRKGDWASTTVLLPERKPLNLQLRLNGDAWPFSGETMEELRHDLDELRDELNDLKIKLDINVDK